MTNEMEVLGKEFNMPKIYKIILVTEPEIIYLETNYIFNPLKICLWT